MLFDGATGRPRAVLDGTEITCWKTAADSALGASLLAPADPQTMVMLGALRDGAVARARAPQCPTVAPPDPGVEPDPRPRRDSRRGAAGQGVAAEATADLPAAVRQAQVISSATRTHTPLIEGAWLQPGAHLDLVGGYTPDTREADDEAARRSRVFPSTAASPPSTGSATSWPRSRAGRSGGRTCAGDLYDLIGGGVPDGSAPTTSPSSRTRAAGISI